MDDNFAEWTGRIWAVDDDLETIPAHGVLIWAYLEKWVVLKIIFLFANLTLKPELFFNNVTNFSIDQHIS